MYTNYMNMLEACLFSNAEPVSIEKLSKTLDIEKDIVISELKKLNEFYRKNNSSLEVIFTENEVQLSARETFYQFIEKLNKKEENQLKPVHFEVLAIIAYKNLPTKAEIDSIRGLNSENPLMHLLKLGYIEIIKLEDDLRLNHYKVTPFFLKKFGFNSFDDLKRGEEFDFIKNVT